MTNFGLDTADPSVHDVLAVTRLERAIRVIYRPDTQRGSHYFGALAAEQFDAVIHLDRTRALEPLERGSPWDEGRAARDLSERRLSDYGSRRDVVR